MRCQVLLFAQLREKTGRSEIDLQLSEDATVSDALAAIAPMGEIGQVAVALNERYVDRQAQLKDGDVIALIPPVSGG